MSARPVPLPDEVSAPYWEHCAQHVLTLPRCARCDGYTFPPDIICMHCQSTEPDFTFMPVSGNGKIRTWTVIRQSFISGFEVPFLLVDVELEGHPDIRIIARLLDGADVPLKIGDAVATEFEDIAPGVSVPAFRLVSGA